MHAAKLLWFFLWRMTLRVFLMLTVLDLATGTIWWVSRRVAEQYMNEVGEPTKHSPARDTSKNSVKQERRA